MTFLFWFCWTFDLLAALFLLWAIGFRTGFGASTGLQQGLLVLLMVMLVGGLVLYVSGRSRLVSVGLVALPILLLIFTWLVSKMSKAS